MTDTPIHTPAEALEAATELVSQFADRLGFCGMINAMNDTDKLAAAIRALASRIPPAPDDEALEGIVAKALADLDDCGDFSYYKIEARAVLTALREAGALR